MLQDHISHIDLYLRLFKFVVQPVVLVLDCILGENLGQASFPDFLQQVFLKLVPPCAWVREIKNWSGQTTAENLSPPENLLPNHLEKSLCVNTCDFYFRLQPSYFVRPGHRLSDNTIWSEFHQRFIDCVKNAFVESFYGIPQSKSSLIRILSSDCQRLLTRCFNIMIKSCWHNRVLTNIESSLEVIAAANIRCLHQIKCIYRWSLYRLRQQLQKLNMDVVVWSHFIVKVRVF